MKAPPDMNKQLTSFLGTTCSYRRHFPCEEHFILIYFLWPEYLRLEQLVSSFNKGRNGGLEEPSHLLSAKCKVCFKYREGRKRDGRGTCSSISLWCHKDPKIKSWDGVKSFAMLLASDNSGKGWGVMKTELWGSVRNVQSTLSWAVVWCLLTDGLAIAKTLWCLLQFPYPDTHPNQDGPTVSCAAAFFSSFHDLTHSLLLPNIFIHFLTQYQAQV